MYRELTFICLLTPIDDQGHGRVCSRLVAGKTSKNPGRCVHEPHHKIIVVTTDK
jgi:hypothetical protein